jgi:hypothetical protein
MSVVTLAVFWWWQESVVRDKPTAWFEVML